VSFLAAKKRICIHPDILQSNDIDTSCRNLNLTSDKCPFNQKKYFTVFKEFMRGGKFEKYDLEDLIKFGKETSACPLNHLDTLNDQSNIIFSPYNYLFIETFKSKISNASICIFDEGRNVIQFSQAAAFFKISHKFWEIVQLSSSECLFETQYYSMFKFIAKLTKEIKLFIEECSTLKSLQRQNDQHHLIELDIKAAFKRWGTNMEETCSIGKMVQSHLEITTKESISPLSHIDVFDAFYQQFAQTF
jgi:hypothetical protein